MSISQDEINFLIWKYFQENGFNHSAFLFGIESLAESSNITVQQIPPGALVTLLQKSLQYMKLEKSIIEAKENPNSQITEGINEIEKEYK